VQQEWKIVIPFGVTYYFSFSVRSMAVLLIVAYCKKKSGVTYTTCIFTTACLQLLHFRAILYFSLDIITYKNERYRP
jgi:hypothetical protein